MRNNQHILENSILYYESNNKPILGEIQCLKDGDYVIGNNGNLTRIESIKSSFYKGMITSISHVGWFDDIKCAYNSKILIKRNNEIIWTRACDCLPSDSVAFPKKKEYEFLNVLRIKDEWKRFTGKTDRCLICGDTKIEARNMCRKHYREFVIENNLKGLSRKNPINNGRYISIDEIKIDNDWLYLLGWYVAEGFSSIKENKGNFLSFSGHEKEYDILEKIRNTIGKIGVNGTIYHNKNNKGIELRVFSHDLSSWFMEWFGHGARNKSLPSQILMLPPEQSRLFLQGYTDGDGYQRNKQTEWTSVSGVLCYQICLLAIRSGFIPTMRKVELKRREYGFHGTSDFCYTGGYSKFCNPDNKRLIEQDDNYIFRPIRIVTTNNIKSRIYDLYTDNENDGVSVGFSVIGNIK